MCNRLRTLISIVSTIVIHAPFAQCADSRSDVLKTPRSVDTDTNVMSPKMDYDDWTPLGRGDPLKNDPTFDYSPPMVDKVKYWINPLYRTPDPPISTKSSPTEFTATTTKYKQSDIKRFYIDFKDHPENVQLVNNKFNKHVRPTYQHYVTRPYPAPLPMLVPPPPAEQSSYSVGKIENSTVLELSWDNTQTLVESTPSMESTTKPEYPLLKLLLTKETTEQPVVTNPTTIMPLTHNPMPFTKRPIPHQQTTPRFSIIQGHSKVRKYGKIDRSDDYVEVQHSNEVSREMKYELPKNVRMGKQLFDDFLPFNGYFKESLKDIITNQAEGSGFGAELTKAMFPAYVRPKPTLQTDTPRKLKLEEFDYY